MGFQQPKLVSLAQQRQEGDPLCYICRVRLAAASRELALVITGHGPSKITSIPEPFGVDQINQTTKH